MTVDSTPTNPVDFDVSEFIACARYGDLDDLNELVSTYLSSHPSTPLPALYTSRTSSNATALHYASANGHLPIVAHLLPSLSPTDVNAQNDDGSTPLHWAALNGHLEVVKALLAAGADATLRNEMGRSAVTVAEQQGHLEVVSVLLASYDPEEAEDGEEAEEKEGGAVEGEASGSGIGSGSCEKPGAGEEAPAP
ncbi:hypothetical protein HDV00_011237 [Rhizophlyctis rosea]|nr:hypothetical protein HDV00_011237 [Rhizophlyctis rosea]